MCFFPPKIWSFLHQFLKCTSTGTPKPLSCSAKKTFEDKVALVWSSGATKLGQTERKWLLENPLVQNCTFCLAGVKLADQGINHSSYSEWGTGKKWPMTFSPLVQVRAGFDSQRAPKAVLWTPLQTFRPQQAWFAPERQCPSTQHSSGSGAVAMQRAREAETGSGGLGSLESHAHQAVP